VHIEYIIILVLNISKSHLQKSVKVLYLNVKLVNISIINRSSKGIILPRENSKNTLTTSPTLQTLLPKEQILHRGLEVSLAEFAVPSFYIVFCSV